MQARRTPTGSPSPHVEPVADRFPLAAMQNRSPTGFRIMTGFPWRHSSLGIA